MAKYTKTTLDKITQIYAELGYKVRFEKGTFKSGYCLLEERKIVVVNRFFDVQGKVQTMIDLLHQIEVDPDLLSEKSQKFYRSLEQQAPAAP
ncbi:MAG: hypothetical protein KTR24_00115 [Saprospiraceae bacterium]|nr:hypothetical protein [Saprospiraceae bacterium]